MSAQLTESNFAGGSVTASTISTEFVYPLTTVTSGSYNYIKRAGTEWCWDVNNASTTSGTFLISYTCKNNGDENQDFRYMDSDGDGYGDFQPLSTSALRVAAPAAVTPGGGLTLTTANTTSPTQQWQPQLVGTDTYQFVNRNSGLCLSLPATSASQATQVVCNGGADQKFTFTLRSTVGLLSFSCANLVTATTNMRTVTYSWTSDYAGGPYTIQARQTAAGAWNTIATSTGTSGNTSASVTAPIGTPLTTWGIGTYGVQILNADGDAVGTGQIRVYRQNPTSGYFYARCT